MEKNSRICKICNKSFSNGKAMGGHMRSHLAKLPIPPKPQLITPKSPNPPSYSYSYSSSSSLNNSSKTHKYFQGRFTLNREVGSQDSVIHDKVVDSTNEIDSNPNNNFTRRRSERRRKAIKRATLIETDQVSSILSNDTFSQVEEVAKCLIMLSRDTWEKRNDNVSRNKLVDENEDEEEEEEEYELVSNKSRIRVRTITKSNRYKCDTCNKVFKSYQALGGHRASHKKTTNQSFENESDDEEGGGSSFNNVIELKKTFECPFCFKVFGSGQALGGHKKVHFSNVTNNTINSRINTITDHNLIIDLNLPAPQEDEEMKTT